MCFKADQTAINYLNDTLSIQKKAFLKDQYPSLKERQRRLTSLADACMAFSQSFFTRSFDRRRRADKVLAGERTYKALLSDFAGAHP